MNVNCNRCNGYLMRDRGFESITHTSIAYHCVNCGNYIDLCILMNRGLSLEARNRAAHKKSGSYMTADETFVVRSVLLGQSSLFDLW